MIFNPVLKECSDIAKKIEGNNRQLEDKSLNWDKEPKCVFAKK